MFGSGAVLKKLQNYLHSNGNSEKDYGRFPPLYFNHVPKVMGTTLHGLLEPCYPLNEMFTTAHHVGDYLPLRALSKKRQDGLRLITGHIPDYVFQSLGREAEFLKITGGRHPFRRMASRLAHYKRSMRAHHVGPTLQAIEEGRYNDAISLMESWYPKESMPAWLLPHCYEKRSDLKKALQTLQNYDAVYCDDSFSSFYQSMQQLLLQEITTVPTRNTAKKGEVDGAVPSDFEPYFMDAFPEDYAFYDAVKQLAKDRPPAAIASSFPASRFDAYTPVISMNSAISLAGWSARVFYAGRWVRFAETSETVLRLPSPDDTDVAKFYLVLGFLSPSNPNNIDIFVNGMPASEWIRERSGTIKRDHNRMYLRANRAGNAEILLTIRHREFFYSTLLLEEISYCCD